MVTENYLKLDSKKGILKTIDMLNVLVAKNPEQLAELIEIKNEVNAKKNLSKEKTQEILGKLEIINKSLSKTEVKKKNESTENKTEEKEVELSPEINQEIIAPKTEIPEIKKIWIEEREEEYQNTLLEVEKITKELEETTNEINEPEQENETEDVEEGEREEDKEYKQHEIKMHETMDFYLKKKKYNEDELKKIENKKWWKKIFDDETEKELTKQTIEECDEYIKKCEQNLKWTQEQLQYNKEKREREKQEIIEQKEQEIKNKKERAEDRKNNPFKYYLLSKMSAQNKKVLFAEENGDSSFNRIKKLFEEDPSGKNLIEWTPRYIITDRDDAITFYLNGYYIKLLNKEEVTTEKGVGIYNENAKYQIYRPDGTPEGNIVKYEEAVKSLREKAEQYQEEQLALFEKEGPLPENEETSTEEETNSKNIDILKTKQEKLNQELAKAKERALKIKTEKERALKYELESVLKRKELLLKKKQEIEARLKEIA